MSRTDLSTAWRISINDTGKLDAESARQLCAGVASVLLLIALWSITHRYRGLTGDAELYAVQAMARIHTGLSRDVFLQFGSQDRYTVFSPVYAWCIRLLGLPIAAVTLLLACKVWLFAASWAFVRSVSDAPVAWLALALLMLGTGVYGGSGLFRYAEDFLTARTLAEALIVSAIALHWYGFRATGLVSALVAFAVHPIMALPGILILLCLESPMRIYLMASGLGILIAGVVSLGVLRTAPNTGPLAVLDPLWFDVVRERSAYLFLQLWTLKDWATHARPLCSLAMTATILADMRVRKLCLAAGVVGAAGLAIALIAGTIGHIAILIQAQVWRWMWIACLLGVLLSVPTAAAICRQRRHGVLPAALLLAGWLLTPVVGTTCMALSLCLWLTRRSPDRTARRLRWGVAVFGIVVVAWLAVLRSTLVLTALTVSLAVGCAFFTPAAFRQMQRDFALTATDAFADWRRIIPPASNVYVAPAHYSAAFAWFTLQRPGYLSVDQSAGVVFARATALEIERRSRNLLPVLDPDWRLHSSSRGAVPPGGTQSSSRPFDRDKLAAVCSDRQLDFVIATEDLPIGRVSTKHVADFKDWSLYDCGQVRSASAAS